MGESGVRELLAALGEEDRIASGAFRRILWISAAGDLMTGRGIDKRLRDGGPEAVFDPGVLRSLRGSDLAPANLEGALTLRGSAARKTYTFRSDPSAASSLADAGFDALLLANNHSLDWGPAGLADTLEALAGAGIAGVGAGRDLGEASRPFRIEIKGQSVAVFGAARFPRERSGWDGARTAAAAGRPGILWLDEAGLDRLRASFRDDVLDIVLFHGDGMVEGTGPPGAGHCLRTCGSRGGHRPRIPSPCGPGTGMAPGPADPLVPGQSSFSREWTGPRAGRRVFWYGRDSRGRGCCTWIPYSLSCSRTGSGRPPLIPARSRL
ncbi:MAG: CapA family protein [Desulfomicrobium escambiense]|nr:CapA family protein [Desulfomicrobium escambiense]